MTVRPVHRVEVASSAFAVHVLPFEHAHAVTGVGTLTRNEGVDKFARFGLRATPKAVTGSPILEDAYLAYACRLAGRRGLAMFPPGGFREPDEGGAEGER